MLKIFQIEPFRDWLNSSVSISISRLHKWCIKTKFFALHTKYSSSINNRSSCDLNNDVFHLIKIFHENRLIKSFLWEEKQWSNLYRGAFLKSCLWIRPYEFLIFFHALVHLDSFQDCENGILKPLTALIIWGLFL